MKNLIFFLKASLVWTCVIVVGLTIFAIPFNAPQTGNRATAATVFAKQPATVSMPKINMDQTAALVGRNETEISNTGSITLIKQATAADGTTFNFTYSGPAADTAVPAYVIQWGSEGSGDGQFAGPPRLAVDNDGNVYAVDSGNNRIQKFDSSGSFLTKWGTSGSGDGEFIEPTGVAVDGSGNVYVADRGNHRIQKFDSSGTFLTKWGSFGSDDSQFRYLGDVAVDGSGNVYVADIGNDRIQKFDSNGIFLTKWGSSGSGDSQFASLRGVAVDGSGNVYVADIDNDRIQKFDSSGTFLTQWSTRGNGNGHGEHPEGVAVDGNDNVYVVHSENDNIQKFDSSGTFLTEWGSNGKGNSQFDIPMDVAVDDNGNVYVAEWFNHRIQKFAPITSTPVTGITAGQSRIFSDLIPGTYTLTETVPSGWVLKNATCDNGVSTTPIDGGIEINLNGEDTTCTFTNVKTIGSITLIMQVHL